MFLIILDSDRLAPEIVEEALSKVEEDHDYDYTWVKYYKYSMFRYLCMLDILEDNIYNLLQHMSAVLCCFIFITCVAWLFL